jgi:glycerol kinase
MPYLLALDQGTSSSRSIVFDLSGRIVAMAQQELPQIYPQSRLGGARPWCDLADTTGHCARGAGQSRDWPLRTFTR